MVLEHHFTEVVEEVALVPLGQMQLVTLEPTEVQELPHPSQEHP
jgi:hypothetical protein